MSAGVSDNAGDWFQITKTFQLAGTGQAQLVVGANAGRVGLFFWPISGLGGSYNVAPDGRVTSNLGWPISGSGPLTWFTYEYWGSVVSGPWWVAGSAVATLVWTELIYRPLNEDTNVP